jgi:Iron-containing redox enzyme
MISPTVNPDSDPEGSTLSGRELFYRLLNPERCVAFFPLARDRIRFELSQCSAIQLDTSRLFHSPAYLDREDFPAVRIPCDLGFADCQTLIRQFAPAALLGQCWLQCYSQAMNCHTDLAAAFFRVYRASLDTNGCRSDVESYRFLHWRLGIDLPPIDSHAFCEHDQLSDLAFRHALVGLCLARCGNDFSDELVGFTAADVFGSSTIFDEELMRQFNDLSVPDVYQASRIRARTTAIGAIQDALSVLLRNSPDIEHTKRRVADGIRLYVGADYQFWSATLESLHTKPSPGNRVLALFRKKARYGQGFHKTIMIGKASLDEWFAGGLSDGPVFLDALAHSEWFDVWNPDNSVFFTRVTAPDGPMSGVFTRNELSILCDWLESRRITGREVAISDISRVVSGPGAARQPLQVRLKTIAALRRPSLREMFFRLVNVYEFPEVLPSARSYVEKCLGYTRCALTLTRKAELKYFRFSHAAFESRVNSIYRHQVDRYRPLQGEPRLDRHGWAGIIKQFAPTVLVDGCWLQNVNDPGMCNCPVSAFLWKIYADEIGNGESRSNHPMIYRRLLESLDVNLPAIDDARFANHEDFIAGAFDIPVYLLAISQFSCSFLPELIGVNLAIELSGLGAGYLRLAESLEYWGIDPTIVRVHQSADNMACGHSAIARRVVGRYLDHIRSLNGEQAMQSHWKRIWLGFVSIRIVPLRFVAHLAWRFLTRDACNRFHLRIPV